MHKVKLFIGSSKASLNAAKAIKRWLVSEGCAEVHLWDEGVFNLSEGTLESLLKAVNSFDFAVTIWGPDDVTESKGQSSAAPRDNVVFECGLFMGRLGKERVFIVRDEEANVKVPSDFAGITLASYKGSRVKKDGKSAVQAACVAIAGRIKEAGRPEFSGEWRSRFAMMAEPDHPAVMDDLKITPAREGILINSLASKVEPYTAYGRIVGNQVVGEWKHKAGENFVEGTFMLVINPRATIMFGYCTGKDENGGTIFSNWVLAKKANLSEDEINHNLDRGQQALRDHTMAPPQFAKPRLT